MATDAVPPPGLAQRVGRTLNSLLARFGLRLSRVVDPRAIKDPAARSIAMGLSTHEHNARANMDAFYSDPHLLTHYFTPDRLAFYDSVRDRLARLGLSPAEVLDVGCGSGHLLAAARKVFPNARLTGIDFSPESIRVARQMHSGVDFDVMSIFEVGTLGRTFDLVLCTEVLEHLVDADVALANLASLCKPGATLVITVPEGRRDTFAGHFNFWTAESFGREFKRYAPAVETLDTYLFIVIAKNGIAPA